MSSGKGWIQNAMMVKLKLFYISLPAFTGL